MARPRTPNPWLATAVHTPTSAATAQPIPITRGREDADYRIRDTITLGPILPVSRGGGSYYSAGRACKTKKGGPRRGQIDLVFVPRGVPKAVRGGRGRPPPPGPALRFCTAESGFAPMLPVSGPREAAQIARAYRSCMADPRATHDACLLDATGQDPNRLAFGGAKRRRRRRR